MITKLKKNDFRWTGLGAVLLTICMLSVGMQGCSSPAGKAATYKTKKASPIHDTKVEKAEKKIDKSTDRDLLQ